MGCRKQSGPFVKIWVHKRPKSARDQCLWGGIWKIFAVSRSSGEMPHILNTVCVCVCVCVCVLAAQSCLTLACQAPLSMGFPGQEYWSGLPSLHQGIFPTQGSNLGLPHHRQILHHLSHHHGKQQTVVV